MHLVVFCCVVGVPEENMDYMSPVFHALVDIIRTKGLDNEFVQTLTTTELHRHDERIMVRMDKLEMLPH